MNPFFLVAFGGAIYLQRSLLLTALLRRSLRRTSAALLRRLVVGTLPLSCALLCTGALTNFRVEKAGTMISQGSGVLLALSLFFVVLPFFTGIHPRDDVVERDNPGAAVALAAAALSFSAIVLGVFKALQKSADVAGGPFVSGLAFLGAWFILEQVTKISEAITIERDFVAGLRLAAFLVALGIYPAHRAMGLGFGGNGMHPGASFLAALQPLVPAILLEHWLLKAAPPPKIARSLLAIVVYLALGVVSTLQ